MNKRMLLGKFLTNWPLMVVGGTVLVSLFKDASMEDIILISKVIILSFGVVYVVWKSIDLGLKIQHEESNKSNSK